MCIVDRPHQLMPRLPHSAETFIATLTKSPDFPRNVPRIDEEVRMSILESLRWGMMSDQEYHALYRTLSRIKLPLYGERRLLMRRYR